MAKQIFVTGFTRKNTTQDMYEFVTFDTIDEMFTAISKIYCFDDCDSTYEVVNIFYHGHEVEYVGWQSGMHFEYRFKENNELAWEGWFERWEH